MSINSDVLETLSQNPFLDKSAVDDLYKKLNRNIKSSSDSKVVRVALSNKDLFADVQADGSH